MQNKVKFRLILSLTSYVLLSPHSAQAVVFNQFNLKLNSIGVSVDNDNRLFVPLGAGFTKAKAFNPVLTYQAIGNQVFECGGVKLKSGGICKFNAVKYGDSPQVIKLFDDTTLVASYSVVFTNLPIVEVTTRAEIVDTPKVQGTLRVMSGEFKQDTGLLPMGAEIAGQTAQNYPEKSYGIQIGTSATQWKTGKKAALLNMPARDDWRLDAAYRDPSKVRNLVVQDIYRTININADKNRPNASPSIKGQPVELILNGDYHGIYILEEKVDRELLDLKKINVPKDASGKSDWAHVNFSLPENFSVLYKTDYASWGGSNPEGIFFDYAPGDIQKNISLVYPKISDASNYPPLKGLVDFIVNSDNQTFSTQIGNRVNLKNLANWWLVVLLSQGHDNENKNFFIARNAGPTATDRKFFIVPWDGDATFGMLWNGQDEGATTYFDTHGNNLILRLLENPQTGFAALLKSQWKAFREGPNAPLTNAKILAYFDRYNARLTLGGAKQREAQRWPKPDDQGVGNPKMATKAYLNNFINIRLSALDNYINRL